MSDLPGKIEVSFKADIRMHVASDLFLVGSLDILGKLPHWENHFHKWFPWPVTVCYMKPHCDSCWPRWRAKRRSYVLLVNPLFVCDALCLCPLSVWRFVLSASCAFVCMSVCLLSMCPSGLTASSILPPHTCPLPPLPWLALVCHVTSSHLSCPSVSG